MHIAYSGRKLSRENEIKKNATGGFVKSQELEEIKSRHYKKKHDCCDLCEQKSVIASNALLYH